MSLIIYTTKEDTYLDKIKEYADYNSWSLSKAVRQILKAFVKVNMPEEAPIQNSITDDMKQGYTKIEWTSETEKKQWEDFHLDNVNLITGEKEPKIDLATFEAQNMAKLNVNQDLEACIKEHTVNGAISCYMFDNAREYRPFCKSECWTNKNI